MATGKQQEESEVKARCSAMNPQNSELGEVKNLLKEMNERIKKLEEEKTKQQEQGTEQPRRGATYRGPRHRRGQRRRGRADRGRGQYHPTRPKGTNTFKPKENTDETFYGYHCGQPGHIARNCLNK